MSNKTKPRKILETAGMVFAIAMCPCLIVFGFGMAQAEPAGVDTAAYSPVQEAPITPSGSEYGESGGALVEEVQVAGLAAADADKQALPGEGQGTSSMASNEAANETEIETESIRERAELMARVKHLADYTRDGEANPDYRKIGYVYTEEMYYKLTGATELPDDWTDQMGPLMRGVIMEEDRFVETLQTDDGAAQAQWMPASSINASMYQTAAYTGTVQTAAIRAVQAAQRKLGYPYSQTRRDSGIAYDCSSLVYWSYLEAGVNIDPGGGHTAASIASYLESTGRGISGGDLQPGDLIFYSYKKNGRYKNISHVAMVAGNGMIVHASSSQKMVVMGSLTLDRAVAVARPVPDAAAGMPETAEGAESAEGGVQAPDASQYGLGTAQGPEPAAAEAETSATEPEALATEPMEGADGGVSLEAPEPTEAAAETTPVIISGQALVPFIPTNQTSGYNYQVPERVPVTL